ncbi:MAG: septum formation initiator family protein [Candidatus Rokubacteria bacterium]|nr:septum formation initiator family protein [Candidatus Rokubacteria bacterium]
MRRSRLLVSGALALATVAFLGLLAYGGSGLVRVWQMKREVGALEQELRRLRSETEQLTRTVDRLREDPAQVEKIAREELGLLKEGEKVLQFPPTPHREDSR